MWGHRTRRALLVAALLITAVAGTAGPAATATKAAEQQPTTVAVEITPSTELVDNMVVTVTGHGFAPGRVVGTAQCAGSGPTLNLDLCQSRGGLLGVADQNGDVALRMVLDAVLYLPWLGGWLQLDCRTTSCSIWIADLTDLGQAARVPLPYVPGSPSLPGELTVTPGEGLVDGQRVTIAGRLFPGGGHVDVRQCVTVASGPPRCEPNRGRPVPILPDGTFTLPFRVDALLSPGGAGTVDCRAVPCEIRVDDSFDSVTEPDAVHPLAFAPDGALAPPFPTTVAPTTDLVDGQQVTVTTSGYDARESVAVLQCATADPAEERCRQLASGTADAQGRFSGTVAVSVALGPAEEPFDCRSGSAPGATPCVLIVGVGGDVRDSNRTALVDLHFDPDGPGPPLPPTPVVTVDPATGLGDFGYVTVNVTDLVPGREVDVAVCAADDDDRCDVPTIRGSGSSDLELLVPVVATFEATDGSVVDCRSAPGCRVRARARNLVGRSEPLEFAPQESERYLDAVFTGVDVTRDLVYRHTHDHDGNPVDLALDLYEPVGDTATDRPVVVWIPGGWFRSVDRAAETDTRIARNLARRGYVVAIVDYRTLGTPGTGFPDFATAAPAAFDAYDDVTAGLGWLAERAAELGIDPDRIVAAGPDAGGVTAVNLAYLPGQRGSATSQVAAAIPLSGVNLGVPQPGEPPVFALHDMHEPHAQLVHAEGTCRDARAVGLVCDVLQMDDLLPRNEHWIVAEATDFLHEQGVITPGEG